MAYQSLYRKYRSRDFGDLVGQLHVTQTLANAITSGRVSHAYLFCGPRGTGKTSTARVLAKAVNCINGPTATPCDECIHCKDIRQGSAMDVVEIDAASNRNIDDIRQLREQVNYPPVELRYKFYIVDEVHQLTRDSFNAFLKTLEEPPAHVIFVLCTTDPHQLPATILSRCQRFDFHRITREEIVERLRWIVEQEGWGIEEEALALLARTANGGMRDALSLLDQAASYAGQQICASHVRDILGGIDLDLLMEFSSTILEQNANKLFQLIDRILSEGKDVPQLVAELILHWRNLLRISFGGADILVEFNPEQRQQLSQQAQLTTQPAIMRAINLLCEAENDLRWNTQQRLLLELCCLRIMTPEKIVTPLSTPTPMAVRPTPVIPATTPVHPAISSIPTPTLQQSDQVQEAKRIASSVTPGEGGWSLPRVTKAWPLFIEWMSRSAQLEQLRTRIVEKSWPSSLVGETLTLATTSAFTRSQLYDRPKVKLAFEQCLSSYFKAPFIVEIEVLDETITAPQSAPVAIKETTAISTSQRDVIGERMAQVFTGCQEIQ